MTGSNPDANKAIKAPKPIGPNDPDYADVVAAVAETRRLSQPVPSAAAGPAPSRGRPAAAMIMRDDAPVAAASRQDRPVAAASRERPPVAAVSAAAAHGIATGAARVNEKRIVVDGKAQVMAVFANPDGNYTVTGYGERSSKSFGDFFLGMDAGPEYDRQAADINAAIQKITVEEGFDLGRDGARAAYKTLNGGKAESGGSLLGRIFGAFRSAPVAGPAPAVDVVSSHMLADVTKALFGIPDEKFIVTGVIGDTEVSRPPSACPADFTPLSASLFWPDPGPRLARGGEVLGQLLAYQTAQLVAKLRATGAPPPGRLTKVLFDTIPPEDDARLVRTLIGTMMGLLPTINGNLVEVMNKLHADNEVPALRAAIARLGADPSYAAVYDILKPLVYAAMQQNPVPKEVWRIAAKDHVISGETEISVKKGDMVVVSIKKATKADHKKKVVDVSAIFGGMRTGKGRRPTHGCPGYAAAMGIIFGALSVILIQDD